jgi:hypothetical protein
VVVVVFLFDFVFVLSPSLLLLDFVRIFDFLSLEIDLGTPTIGTLSLDHFECLVRAYHGCVFRSSSLIQKSKTPITIEILDLFEEFRSFHAQTSQISSPPSSLVACKN